MMISNSATPGVYYERVDATAPGIAALRTDVAGFVGIAARGPLHTAVPVQSWRQFEAYCGSFTGAGYLAYAVRAFFENGGRRCWVVRVASEAAATAQALFSTKTAPRWVVQAISPGVWGNDLTVELRETNRAQTVTDPPYSIPEYATVITTSGFSRAMLVRLTQKVETQNTAETQYKVISDVDAVAKRLLWVHPDPVARLPYDAPLHGFDPNRPILVESVEYTLIVREAGRLRQVYEKLSLVPEHSRYGPAALPPLPDRRDLKALQLPAAPEPISLAEYSQETAKPTCTDIEPLDIPVAPPVALAGGADGLALLIAGDFIGEAVSPFDSDTVKALKQRGLGALEEIDEVAMVAIPDIHIQPQQPPVIAPLPPCIPDPCLEGPPAQAIPTAPDLGDLPPRFSEQDVYRVQAALIEHCERLRNRIALLDAPFATARNDALGSGSVRAWRQRFDTSFAAFYYPWLRVVDPLRTPSALTRDIPPSGHVAGQYAQSDFQVGVYKTPANSPLGWTQDVTVSVDDPVHGLLNADGINIIRAFPGRGIRIFGARTVSSDPDWRFVNVRRLLLMIEKAIAVAIQWAVFEPNNVFTRAKLNLVLTSFLLALWQNGALAGASREEAFFVKCDEENNPPGERDRGRMVADVGVAPSQPFEFVVLRVGRTDNEFEITESAAGPWQSRR